MDARHERRRWDGATEARRASGASCQTGLWWPPVWVMEDTMDVMEISPFGADSSRSLVILCEALMTFLTLSIHECMNTEYPTQSTHHLANVVVS